MTGNAVPYRGRVVAFFDGDEDLTWVEDLETSTALNGGLDKLIYVCWEGTDNPNLNPNNFLVKNYNASLVNSLMWDGHFTEEEQEKRVWEIVDRFIDTGKQYLVEEYEFSEDEPFYDYSGGREELE